MKNIYIVMEYNCDDHRIRAVFTSKEKADKYIEMCDELNTDESIFFVADSWLVDAV